MIKATVPGATLGDVLRAAQAAYEKYGFADEWTQHHQGGPTGYLTREERATPESKTIIRLNQAFAWNPTIAGTKSEGTTLLTEQGPEVITVTGDWPIVVFEGIPRCDILALHTE